MGAVAKLFARGDEPTKEPAAVIAARRKLEAAQAEHEREQARVADIDAELTKLEKSFAETASDKIADQIVHLQTDRAKRQLFVNRTAALVEQARAGLTAAEAQIRAERLAYLDREIAATRDRVEELCRDEFVPIARKLVRLLNDMQQTIDHGVECSIESKRLGGSDEAANARHGLSSLSMLPGVRIREALGRDIELVSRMFK